MNKLALAGILLVPALVLIAVGSGAVGTALDDRVAEDGPLEPFVDFYDKPADNPQLFCFARDPNPVTDLSGAGLVLQDCAAGKTFTVSRGTTIGVDLTNSGFDGFEIHDLVVSDWSILQTVEAPRTFPTTTGDYVAVYRASRSGRATISALFRYCNGHSCVDSLRWITTVRVS
ncbi:MAG TPA: hypothetical protein VJS19_00525 [Candidatus Dormibacteraeota bacterium]|nr:hypothetical protein [Candidatus Dormibacteraeota bacterium]